MKAFKKIRTSNSDLMSVQDNVRDALLQLENSIKNINVSGGGFSDVLVDFNIPSTAGVDVPGVAIPHGLSYTPRGAIVISGSSLFSGLYAAVSGVDDTNIYFDVSSTFDFKVNIGVVK